MTTFELVERISDRTERRGFLAKAAAASLGAAAAVFATADTASAHPFQHCCCLCYNPNPCGYSGCAWCWPGCCHKNPEGGNAHQTYCCEGYAAGYSCNGGCAGVQCSFYGSSIYGCSTNHSPGYCPCDAGCCCTR
jgi:hypothetical protein